MVTAHFQKLINNVVGGFLFIVLWDRVSKPSRHPLQKSRCGGGARWASILPCVVVSDFSSMLFVLFGKQHRLTVHRIQCKKALCCEGILLRFTVGAEEVSMLSYFNFALIPTWAVSTSGLGYLCTHAVLSSTQASTTTSQSQHPFLLRSKTTSESFSTQCCREQTPIH